MDFEEERKRILFGFLTSVACVMLFVFGGVHWSSGSLTEALVCFSVAAALIVGVCVLRRMDQGLHLFRGITATFFVLFVYLATVADEQSGRAVWVLGYPVCAYFVAGVRFGAFSSALLLAVWLAAFFLPRSWTGAPDYSPAFEVRFIAAYLAINFVAMILEQVRHKYFEAMVEYQRRLEMDKAHLQASETRLTTMALRDHLTGVANPPPDTPAARPRSEIHDSFERRTLYCHA